MECGVTGSSSSVIFYNIVFNLQDLLIINTSTNQSSSTLHITLVYQIYVGYAPNGSIQ